MIRRLIIVISCAGRLVGQEPSHEKGWVVVETVPRGADVYIDSQFCGKTPVERFTLAAGKHVVSAFIPSLTSWNGFSKTDTITIVANQETKLKWDLGALVVINSIPSGSSIQLEGRLLGVTPFVLRSSEALKGEMLVQKEGFQAARVGIDDTRSLHVVLLKPLNGQNENLSPDVLGPITNGETSGQLIHYVAGATMIASGFLSAYFKAQANTNFREYQSSQDPARLDATGKFDRLSGFSFTLMQFSFGVLAYKLLLE
ncbi:MAG: PEGA domain-containing protein [Bacteroidota bacterium]